MNSSTQNELELQISATNGQNTGISGSLEEDLRSFCLVNEKTREIVSAYEDHGKNRLNLPAFINEFWTAKQRDGHRLHEISYRACFKPQLPAFFIERLTQPGDVVHDPFMGRGTTLLESALLRRIPYGNDGNPLSRILIRPRLNPPQQDSVTERIHSLDLSKSEDCPDDLLEFYHPETLKELSALRRYFIDREQQQQMDTVDHWLRMVATNRLTGHSAGFFSVYTLPPNQATTAAAQKRINEKRNQAPPRRDVKEILEKKSNQLLKTLNEEERDQLNQSFKQSKLLTGPADQTDQIPDASVSLVVTSPPFLNIVQYSTDNWLRCWFNGIDMDSVSISTPSSVESWKTIMTNVFAELSRILKPGGHVAFEVGEVRKGKVKLEEAVIPCGSASGLSPRLILINDQEFTKTANCWGVSNNSGGTNTNRIVLFQKKA